VPELNLKQLLADAADEVLSTMFFAMLDAPAEAGEDALCTQVRVAFEGHATGALTLSVSPEATVEITANFLGLDSDPPAPPAEQEAVVKELANIICGAVLSRLESSDVLHLRSPELLAADDAATPALPGSLLAEQRFSVGAGFLRLRFQWDGAR
jgi:hypothetical protein